MAHSNTDLSSYTLSDSIDEDALPSVSSPVARPHSERKSKFENPSIDSVEAGGLFSNARATTSQATPAAREEPSFSTPGLYPASTTQQQQPTGESQMSSSLVSGGSTSYELSAGGTSDFGITAGGNHTGGGSYIGGMPVSSVSTYPQQQAGAPYTGSPAYTAGQQVPTVGVKGNPANSGGYSSDYTSSGSFGIDAGEEQRGTYDAPAHRSNPYTYSTPPRNTNYGPSYGYDNSPYSMQGYQGTSASATPSSAITFQQWQQSPASGSQYPSRLGNVRDEYYDDSFSEDEYSLQEGHPSRSFAQDGHVKAKTKLDYSTESGEYSGDISFRGANSRPATAGKKGKRDQNQSNFEDTMKGRLEATVAENMKRHISTWDSLDVCNWIEASGFLQYRKKFAHNCIDGPLLMAMTDEQMRKGLNILPLGHRETIKKKIQELKQLSDAFGEDASTRNKGKAEASAKRGPRVPASASPSVIPAADSFLGPAQGKMTVKEQRNRLNYELDRMANKAAQANALIQQLSHNKSLTEEEVRRLKGQLTVIEAEYKASERKTGVAVDPDAAVPWRHNNFWTEERHPERFGRPGDDPTVDMTFTPRITRLSDLPKDKDFEEIKDGVKYVYSLPTVWERMEKANKKKEDMKEKVDQLKSDAKQEQNTANLGEAVAEMRAGGKAGAGIGYWIPGGVGNKHKLPKGSKQEDQVPDKEVAEMSKNVKFLEEKFIEWQCERRIGPPPGTSKREARFPYPELLEGVDDFIDALLTPKNEVIGAFPNAVKTFFRNSNFDLEMKKNSAGKWVLDPVLKRLGAMKGIEKISELDEAKLKLTLMGKPKEKGDTNTNPIADMIMKRKCAKVKAAAGMIHMAGFVSSQWRGQKKAKAGDESSDDDDAKEAAKKKREQKRSGRHALPRGPWIANGIMDRGMNRGGDLVTQRMGFFRKKIGVENATIEAGRQQTEGDKAEALEKDAEKANQFFQLLGWHHAIPPELSNADPPPQIDEHGEWINKLLKRALAIAGLKDQQVDMTKQVKAHKAEIIKDLTLKLSRLHPKDPIAKELQARLSKVKSFSMDIEPPPPINFEEQEWRDDGLQHLQDLELEHVRDRLNRQWERERRKRGAAAVKAANQMHDLNQIGDVDWETADQPGWNVDDLILSHDYLTYCTQLLGQLSTSELTKFLRIYPSGLEADHEQAHNAGKEEGTGGLVLQRYGDDDGGDDDAEAARKRRQFQSRSLKNKKAKVFRAITTMKFVEFTDSKIHERDTKLANAIGSLDLEKKSKQRVITPSEQDNFFARLLGDIDARRDAAEARAMAQINHEKETMQHFKANPYTPPPPRPTSSRYRTRSPGSGRSSPGATSPSNQSPARGQQNPPGQGRSVSPRPGGGFAYWDMGSDSLPSTPGGKHKPSGQQQRPASAAARPRQMRPRAGAQQQQDMYYPNGELVPQEQRPRSAHIGGARAQRPPSRPGTQTALSDRRQGPGDPGTFGQATQRPGGRKVGTSPEAQRRRSPPRVATARAPPGQQHAAGQQQQQQQGPPQHTQAQQQPSQGAADRGGFQPLLSDSDNSPLPSPQNRQGS